MSVSASNWPVASFASICSARMGEPHSTCSASASLPQRLETSSHLSEKAPHMQFRTFFCNEIADRAFHHAPGGRGAEINELLRVEQLLQLRLDLGVEVFEALPAMADHRGAKGVEGFFADFDRSRDMQFHVCHKQGVKTFTGRTRRQAPSSTCNIGRPSDAVQILLSPRR